MSERGLGEVFTVCEGALHYVWICIKAQMCCLCGRLIWDVDLFFGPFPQGVDDFPGCVGQGAGPGFPCMVGVLLCMSVSVCPYLRYSLQCRVREAGSCWCLQRSSWAFILWQRLNVEARDTIERLSSSLLVLHKATGSSHRTRNPIRPTTRPVSVLLSKESAERDILGHVRVAALSSIVPRGIWRPSMHKEEQITGFSKKQNWTTWAMSLLDFF